MGLRTAGVGHFTIPTAPAAGTSCTSGAANTFTTTYVQLISSTVAALLITGIIVEEAAVLASTYGVCVQLATGGAGSETVIGQYITPLTTGSTVAIGYHPINPPIPVAASTRIAVKTADSVGSKATLITLECIAQANVVDDGIAIGTVTTVTNQLTAAAIATGVWQDTTAGDFTVSASIGKSVMNGVALGTGLTINGYTGNTPQTGDSFARIGVAGIGLTNLGDTRIGNLDAAISTRSVYAGGAVASVTGAVGSVTGLSALIGTPAGASVSADIAAIKANATTLITGVNVAQMNGATVYGNGSSGNLWRGTV